MCMHTKPAHTHKKWRRIWSELSKKKGDHHHRKEKKKEERSSPQNSELLIVVHDESLVSFKTKKKGKLTIVIHRCIIIALTEKGGTAGAHRVRTSIRTSIRFRATSNTFFFGGEGGSRCGIRCVRISACLCMYAYPATGKKYEHCSSEI